MKRNSEFYQVVAILEYETHNLQRTFEANNFETTLKAFATMEETLKSKQLQRYELTLQKICKGYTQIIKIRSSDGELINSPLF